MPSVMHCFALGVKRNAVKGIRWMPRLSEAMKDVAWLR